MLVARVGHAGLSFKVDVGKQQRIPCDNERNELVFGGGND
jgi:hypothetical protein